MSITPPSPSADLQQLSSAKPANVPLQRSGRRPQGNPNQANSAPEATGSPPPRPEPAGEQGTNAHRWSPGSSSPGQATQRTKPASSPTDQRNTGGPPCAPMRAPNQGPPSRHQISIPRQPLPAYQRKAHAAIRCTPPAHKSCAALARGQPSKSTNKKKMGGCGPKLTAEGLPNHHSPLLASPLGLKSPRQPPPEPWRAAAAHTAPAPPDLPIQAWGHAASVTRPRAQRPGPARLCPGGSPA
ncbi:hypothetical protein NDU88_003306 [Pleurodeles waltl]|uniref:Uncharacterized protein n=1 Tax=Pleurodeles waltl TaxID=8319 RepID=A0AAV7VH25_PLEWA|nr:hypothetical protein NDU88_003306 [Pleurodeles waltl]